MTNQNENVAAATPSHSDFSIDHILHRAGNSSTGHDAAPDGLEAFSWLHCSRYCPPKVPRTQRREGSQRRQLGRHPRIPFTSQQLAVLEEKFQQSPYLSSEEVVALSRKLQLADIRVKIWFQNRRARERREKAPPSVDAGAQDRPNEESSPEIASDGSSSRQFCIVSPLFFHNYLKTFPSSPSGNS